jgi:outer membrane protein OmpA-like peptidoglycan-associated protein
VKIFKTKTMLRKLKLIPKLYLPAMLLGGIALQAQVVQRPQPKFWFGASAAANLNFYTGTTQVLNSDVTAPAAFHKGFGVGPYASLFFEYRPHPVWGFMLNAAYDGRGGKFDGATAPCNCAESLTTSVNYLSIEPSLRIAPFSSGFYLFAGPVFSYGLSNSFTYKQDLQPDAKGQFSNMQSMVWSGQVGAGYDIPLSKATSLSQVNLSPFISYHPYFGQEPRSVESWSLSTLRIGVAIKFGKAKAAPEGAAAIVPVADPGVQFTVKAPASIPAKRKVKETFPVGNYVFFDAGNSAIPARYVKLDKEQAIVFKESQLQNPEPTDAAGRSDRQLNVYYNVLNILGSRMRDNPGTNVTLIGSSAGNGADAGKVYAENAKNYLTDVFGIAPARITTEGRDEPVAPNEHPGGKKDLEMLRDGDRRVDIVSASTMLMAPLQITAIQKDPIDSRVVFNASEGSKATFKSWSLEITDDKGVVQHYGAFTREKESISGNAILGANNSGNYRVVMIGTTKDGVIIKKESTLHLMRDAQPKEEGRRYSVLFGFDKSTTVASYSKFLTETVAPLVPDNATVIIHGHSDITGDEDHNRTLSEERATETQRILEQAIDKLGKKGVHYESYGFGSDTSSAPFENNLPEERVYNRTVIIDVVPVN